MPVFSRRHRNLLQLSTGILLFLALYCVAAKKGYGLPCLFQLLTGLMFPGCPTNWGMTPQEALEWADTDNCVYKDRTAKEAEEK